MGYVWELEPHQYFLCLMMNGLVWIRNGMVHYRLMEGGAETGFRHVEPVEYKPRLLQFNGKGRHITVKEVRNPKRPPTLSILAFSPKNF